MDIEAQPRVRREKAPPALFLIVLAAALPFPVAAGLYSYAAPDLARPALTMILTWSVTTLSFLGGVRWGIETMRPQPRWSRMLIAVAAAVTAWALMLLRYRLDDAWVLGGCIAAFLVQWLLDHQRPDTPARYPLLSTILTAAACLSLAVCLEHALAA